MIAVIRPTRALSFTRSEIALDEIRDSFDMRVFRSFDKPIPNCFNDLVEGALLHKPDYILFLEEDIVLPLDKFREMLNIDVDIVFVDYSVNGFSCSARNKEGEILWCGVGATLVKAQVFDKLEKPYFRTDKTLRLNDNKWIDNPAKYGGQDIWFFTKCREAGFKITQIEGELEHLELVSLGVKEMNNGLHNVGIRDKISKLQIIDF